MKPRSFPIKPVQLVLAALSLAALPCSADVLATNLGPGNSYQAYNTYVLGEFGAGSEAAVEFTPSVSATLTDIQAAVIPWGNTSNQYFFTLNSDAGGQPGAVLDSLQTGVFFITPSGGALLETADSTLSPVLQAGVNYWLVLTGDTGGGSTPAWAFNDQGANGLDFYYSPNWTPNGGATPAFQIDGTPLATAPEPSSVALLFAVVAGVFGLLRRKVRPVCNASFPTE